MDGDQADLVGDHVVELARDAKALVLGGLLALLPVAGHHVEKELAARAHVVADHPGDERRRARRK